MTAEMNTPERHVLVDTDTGVDDALAILTALNAPDTSVIGIGTVFGNCTEHQAAQNVLTVLAAVNRTDIPVCVGSPRPGPAPTTPSPHGSDGLGGRGLQPPPSVRLSDETAVDQILRTGRERPGQVDLLCLAPLTNIAAAITRDPTILRQFRSVTIMGGMGTVDRREIVAAAQPKFLVKGDTNTNHDPAAAATVAATPGPVTWVGMDVTGRLRLRWADLQTLTSTSNIARFIQTITEDYHVYCTNTYGAEQPIYTSHDSVATSVMLDPTVILSSVSATAQVHSADGRSALWGHYPDDRSAVHQMATDLDYAAIRNRVDRTLAGSGEH